MSYEGIRNETSLVASKQPTTLSMTTVTGTGVVYRYQPEALNGRNHTSETELPHSIVSSPTNTTSKNERAVLYDCASAFLYIPKPTTKSKR